MKCTGNTSKVAQKNRIISRYLYVPLLIDGIKNWEDTFSSLVDEPLRKNCFQCTISTSYQRVKIFEIFPENSRSRENRKELVHIRAYRNLWRRQRCELQKFGSLKTAFVVIHCSKIAKIWLWIKDVDKRSFWG